MVGRSAAKTMKRSIKDYTILIFFLFFLSSSDIANAGDTINTTQIIRNGDIIASAIFELGFFNPGNSTNLYVGLWYKNIAVRTPIWVVNRVSPLRNTTSGVLKVIQSGQLILQDENNNTIWSSNTSRILLNPIAQLLDSGNLVIREANDVRPENYLWQSFDYPTGACLPGMDFGWNLITGKESFLSSWTSNDDPAPGPFTLHLDITGYPQMAIKRENVVLYKRGPWNGVRFSGIQTVRQDPMYRANLFMNSTVVYYREYRVGDVWRVTINEFGVAQRWRWVAQSHEWVTYYNWPTDICDTYRLCGAHGSCNIGNSPTCGCLDRFVPRDEEGWTRWNWSGGCVRKSPLNCKGDVFLRYSGIKMPDAQFTWYSASLSREECENVCLRNCSCMAYSNLDIRNGGSGCLIWFGDLVDIRLVPGEEQEIYIRMAASELATNDFSTSNKLGEGGFGPVYKGMLEDGMEIAVKRLSRTSMQGLDEFKNEVICISKLQHRNLVKLLGCCIQGEEKLLIYEYMPNKSLDFFLFGKGFPNTTSNFVL
ncbi:Non-specific serine/threonine protein kinase [Handroanthus impetiginosus]|uniref:non-specific serine/threonine protein kinase n=1 Tax=Handroanthus impetiginosus TaxID=429701 RepID=A0A2G9G020_9LAMI|nr:Non-specific serine/threonine protein kinase [Handroanthus impetiginosus]